MTEEELKEHCLSMFAERWKEKRKNIGFEQWLKTKFTAENIREVIGEESPQKLASRLEKNVKIRHSRWSFYCPLSIYISDQLLKRVYISDNHAYFRNWYKAPQEVMQVALPQNAVDFINLFDAGEFPNLLDVNEDQKACKDRIQKMVIEAIQDSFIQAPDNTPTPEEWWSKIKPLNKDRDILTEKDIKNARKSENEINAAASEYVEYIKTLIKENQK